MYILPQIIIIFTVLWLEILLGLAILTQLPRFIQKLFRSKDPISNLPTVLSEQAGTAYLLSLAFVLGLIFHLASAFLLCCTQINWWLAWLMPLLLAFYGYQKFIVIFERVKFSFNLNLFLWLLVNLLIAISLFSATDSVKTLWSNNYGDLAFHLGMIRYFTVASDFPPELHIFPGVQQGYPVFINFWTASSALLNDSLRSLKIIFVIQWMVIWTAIYFLLQGKKFYLLPWAILFAGGNYFIIEKYSWNILREGYPWTVFLSTIWVTQRSAMLGALVLIASITMFEKLQQQNRTTALGLATLLLSFGFLAHVHCVLAGLLYLGLRTVFQKNLGKLSKELLVLLLAALPVLIFIPLISNKTSALSFMLGWTVSQPGELLISLKMWLQNCWQVGVLFLAVFLARKNFVFILIFIVLFVFGNLLKLSYWDWDQIKYFLGVYVILIALIPQIKLNHIVREVAVCAALILVMLPATWETVRIFKNATMAEVYSKESIRLAQEVMRATPVNAIIAAQPAHNHFITLTGRRLFYGYPGTLWTHGIDYNKSKRHPIQHNLDQLVRCKKEQLDDICPDYLVWLQPEKTHWKKTELPMQFLETTSLPYLFKIKG